MKNEILQSLIELKNLTEQFGNVLLAELLKELNGRRLLVVRLAALEDFSINELASVFAIPLDEMTDYHIALMNMDWGQANDATGEKRRLQIKLSSAIDNINELKDKSPELTRCIGIVFNCMQAMHLGKSFLQLMLSAIKEHSLANILELFIANNISGTARALQENFRQFLPEKIINASLNKLRIIEEKLQKLSELVKSSNVDLLDFYQKQYELQPSEENLQSLLDQYWKEPFSKRWEIYQGLLNECRILSETIEQAQRLVNLHCAHTARNGYIPLLEMEELQSLKQSFSIKKAILTEFQQAIEQCIDPADDLHYDPEAKFYYALLLLNERQLDEKLSAIIETHLSGYVNNSPKSNANIMLAYALLFLLSLKASYATVSIPEDTLAFFASKAFGLEEENDGCGLGYFISALRGFYFAKLIQTKLQQKKTELEAMASSNSSQHIEPEAPGQLSQKIVSLKDSLTAKIDNEIKMMIIAAAEKGFDFKSFVNQILASNLDNGLLDPCMIANLRAIDPHISQQYAYILSALICQELHQYELGSQYLAAIAHSEYKFDDPRVQQPINCLKNLCDHKESIQMMRGIKRRLEGNLVENNDLEEVGFITIILMPSITRILDAQASYCTLKNFLQIVSQELNGIIQNSCQHRELAELTITQILSIINKEFLVFSADFESLGQGLHDQVETIAKLPECTEILPRYQQECSVFGKIMAYRCVQIIRTSSQQFSGNQNGLFHHQEPSDPGLAPGTDTQHQASTS